MPSITRVNGPHKEEEKTKSISNLGNSQSCKEIDKVDTFVHIE